MDGEGGSAGARVAIGAGTNLGARRAHLRRAAAELGRLLTDLRCSRVYETEPVGVAGGPFLNLCCTGRTELGPGALLEELQALERRAGRPDPPRRGSRTLDMDLLLYGELTLYEPELRVPHPRLAERAFVLVPLAEVAGDWIVPGAGATVEELAERVGASGVRPAGTLKRTEER